MGNAFSELNDPIDQLKRFLQQGKAIEAGDDEAGGAARALCDDAAVGIDPGGEAGVGRDQ